MTTTALLRGSAARVRAARQSAFATQATTGFKELHVLAPSSIEPVRALGEDPTIGAGFGNDLDARPAAPGLQEAKGSIKVPLDLDQIGVWLTALLGDDAAATGSSPNYVHTRKSGKSVIPALTLEVQHASDQLDLGVGMVVSAMTFQIGSEGGYHSVDVELVGRSCAPITATIAGTPTAMALANRIAKAIGRLSIGGTNVGTILSGTLKISAQVALDRYVGDDAPSCAYVDGYTVDLDITARFKDSALVAHGAVGADNLPTALAVQVEYQVNANRGLLFDLPAVRFEPVSRPIEANGVRQLQLKGRAEVAASSPMLTATLKNGQTGTVYA